MSTFGALAMPFQSDLLAASQATGIPLPLLAAQIMQESTFNPAAVSSTGAIGLGQVLPSTARDPGYGVTPIDPAKLTDPAENIRFTANYLAARGKAAGVEDWNDPAQAAKGLTAYNGGGDPKHAVNVFRHVQPAGAVMQPLAGSSAPAASAQPAAPMGNGEQPQTPALRPFFKPQTVPVRAGVDMEGISPGARGIFEALSKANIPGLEVVSGYRDPQRNARVGGAKGSQHVHGNALDINIEKLSEAQRQQVIDAAIAAGARGIGIYPGGRSLHFDVRETPTAWGANPSSPYSGVSDPNAYPSWARAGVAKLFGTELPNQVAAYAPTTGGPKRPSPFAPSQESSSTMATNPADLPAPGAVPTMAPAAPGASIYATPAPAWGQADEEQLLMALALLQNAIPNGQPAKDIGSVMAPVLAMRSKREDRTYQRNRDERDYRLRLDEIRRTQSNADRSYEIQRRQADEPRYVTGPTGETIAIPQGGGAPTTVVPGRPLVQKFEDDAGNVVWKQYNPASRNWDPLSSGPSPTVPQPATPGLQATPQGAQDMQGPPIPPEMLPPVAGAPAAPAQPASVIPTPPPGVNRQKWIEFHQQEYAKRTLPPGSEEVTGLRKEVHGLPSYKNVTSAAPVYNSMLEAAGRNDRASDVNLIYGMAKLMDPGSVVRESEMTVAQAIATLPEQLRNTVQSEITSKGRLSPDVREGIMREAYSRMGAYKQMYDQDADMYRGIIGRRGMNEADVLPGFKEFKEYKRKGDGGTGGAEGGTTPAPSRRELQNVDLINKSRAANGQPLKALSPEHAMTLPPGSRFEIPDGSGRIGVVPGGR